MVGDVEGREGGEVVVVDGDVVVEEVSKELGNGRVEVWNSGCKNEVQSAALRGPELLDIWLGEVRSYARLGIIGVCG